MSTRLEELPYWITEMNMGIHCVDSWTERGINLFGNPLVIPPIDIVKQGMKAIKNYHVSNPLTGNGTQNKRHHIFILNQELGIDLELNEVAAFLNGLCEYAYFSFGSGQITFEDNVVSKPLTHIKIKEQLTVNPKNDQVVFTKRSYKNHYFLETVASVTIISIKDWPQYTQLPRNNGVVYAMAFMLARKIKDPFDYCNMPGCIYNFLKEKGSVDKGMKEGIVCQDCLNKLNLNL